MWEQYKTIVSNYPRLSFEEERLLIAKAQAGNKRCRDKLVLSHIRFTMWRLRKKIFNRYLVRYGEDMLAGAIPILYRTVETYNLNYRNADNKPKPVRFVSYIWKWIDGFALAYVKKEIRASCTDDTGARKSRRKAARCRILCGKPAGIL